jgi:hypothetical protein
MAGALLVACTNGSKGNGPEDGFIEVASYDTAGEGGRLREIVTLNSDRGQHSVKRSTSGDVRIRTLSVDGKMLQTIAVDRSGHISTKQSPLTLGFSRASFQVQSFSDIGLTALSVATNPPSDNPNQGGTVDYSKIWFDKPGDDRVLLGFPQDTDVQAPTTTVGPSLLYHGNQWWKWDTSRTPPPQTARELAVAACERLLNSPDYKRVSTQCSDLIPAGGPERHS